MEDLKEKKEILEFLQSELKMVRGHIDEQVTSLEKEEQGLVDFLKAVLNLILYFDECVLDGRTRVVPSRYEFYDEMAERLKEELDDDSLSLYRKVVNLTSVSENDLERMNQEFDHAGLEYQAVWEYLISSGLANIFMFAGSVVFCQSLAVQLLNEVDLFSFRRFTRTPENKEWLRQHLGDYAPKDERVDHFPAIKKKILSNPCHVDTLLFCKVLHKKLDEEVLEVLGIETPIAAKMLASMGIDPQEV